MNYKKIVLITFGIFLTACTGPTPPTADVTDFASCVAAGNPIMESYPRQCNTPDGKHFTEDVGNALEKQDVIRTISPLPGDRVAGTLTVEGEARGTWYFEASFPLVLVDEAGNELATSHAEAQDEWMTEEFVPFKGEIVIPADAQGKGTLLLKKDNPSGLPENEDILKIPVVF